MLTELVRQDSIAGDLANASTPGYKPRRLAVQLRRRPQRRPGAPSPRPLGYGAQISKTSVDMTQGPLESTGEPLDLALQGPGFLAVQTAHGTRYTRDGQLAVDGQGRLVTATGNPLLDQPGKPIALGAHSGDLKVSMDGAITAGGKSARLARRRLAHEPAEGRRQPFTGTPGASPPERRSTRARSRARPSTRRP